MISKKDILKMVRHIKRASDGLPDRALMHPVREWCIGLLCFIVLGVAGGLYSVKMYMYYLALDQEVTGEAIAIEEYKQSNADEALKIFGNKKIKFQLLVSGLPVVDTDTEILIEEDITATTTRESIEEPKEEQSETVQPNIEEAPNPDALIVD